MNKSANSMIDDKHSYGIKKTNYYDLFELDYYKPNNFNQSKHLPKIFHIQNHIR